MSAAFKALQEKLEAEATTYRTIQKDMSKHIQSKTQYMQQLQENQMVMKELEVVEDEANVYKLIGPMLIKQDLVEAKANVGKRLEYINAEIKRADGAYKGLEKREREVQDEIMKLQKQMQAMQQRAAAA
mmetsp:Transcript_22558/g.49420  ORF Transcript_22558/g.49420 Transcript_22558/m.49420 type:complete len:129 (-) Transcript_22558:429-815(-)|eukprot:CAMPEP_0118932534 /NCGR_PEP_ID=MMETSP1169-20130426/10478_1 /TAXON_ID=36882 /ORGANISM="Pyramimonas obovata, Strain CCMP722" /LENGTH=128 /DNA_ID=CAMNT_0006875203 /DNA_START=115 /DNA_END=501 /DNA_ORIENTATION=-